MLGEITHLQTISEDLKTLTMDPHKLPSASEQVGTETSSYIMQYNVTRLRHGFCYRTGRWLLPSRPKEVAKKTQEGQSVILGVHIHDDT